MKIHTITIEGSDMPIDTDCLGRQLYALMRAQPANHQSTETDKELLEGLETFISELKYHLTKKD